MQLQHNTVLITGGTSGFGVEFIKHFISLHCTVIITGRNQEKLDETKKMFPQVHTFQSDVSRPGEIEKLYASVITRFPNLNIIINNAGEMRKINLHDVSIDLEDITREVDINLSGPIRMVQQFLPHLKKQKQAAIMNVTSAIAFMAFPISPIYGATKSGLRSYTQSLRVQLKKTNIRVFELVAPGSSTPLNHKFIGMEGYDANMLMAPEKIVDKAIDGMKKDKYEIYPGLANMVRILTRLAPKFVFNRGSKMGESYFLHS
jgi:uncharacterized oxidoreductase